MSLTSVGHRWLQSVGFDIHRWPESDPAAQRGKLLRQHAIDLVLDVGANDGGFARSLRRHGYRGRIVSFEPLSAPRLRISHENVDDSWSVLPYALGRSVGEIDIHVSANREASSSVLSMLPSHVAAAPQAAVIGSEKCSLRTLDSLWPEIGVGDSIVYLKIDVQGYEGAVLDGALSALDHVRGIQVELSLIPLYEGAALWDALLARLVNVGFLLARIDPVLTDESTGRTLQVDAVLFRQI